MELAKYVSLRYINHCAIESESNDEVTICQNSMSVRM